MDRRGPDITRERTRLDPSRRDVLRMGLAGMAAIAAQPVYAWLPAWQQATTGPLKRIYLAPDDHTDLFWTADDAAYRDAFVRMIDYYLDLADETASLPADFQSRWNCDGSYWVWVYERAKPAADFERLIARLRDGHLNMPLNALVINNGGAPAEAVLRGMYYAGQLERRYGLRFPIAISMENQTLPLGLTSLWAGAGARYSWKGICGCDTVVQAAVREREIYWAEGLDGSRILMKWNSRLVDNTGIGGYAEARDPAGIVEYVDTDGGFLARYPYQVVGAFGKGWDDLETKTDEFVTVAQNTTTAHRRVIVSNQRDFFEDFEATHGHEIPSAALSFGNEWDLYCAALAEVSSQIKRAVEALRGAEALATLAMQLDPAFMRGREAARDLAWMNLGLYWEHNFGLAGRDDFRDVRIAWQRQLAAEVTEYVETLQRDAQALIARALLSATDETRYFVFNALSWSRTDVVELLVNDTEAVHVFDLESGAELTAQQIVRGEHSFLRVLVPDVPPLGYRLVAVRAGSGQSTPPTIEVSEGVLETSRYRVTVSGNGAVTSWIDKSMGDRELIQTNGGRTANDLGTGGGTVTTGSVGPVSATVIATGDGPLAHRTEVTLYEGVDRVEIANEITQNFDETQTWAFSFNLADVALRHEELGAILRAQLVDAGGHYSAQNARYDWLTLNHFADLRDGAGYGVTLSNADCYFMRFGASTADWLDVSTAQINVLAGGRVGGDGRFGIRDQGGDSLFRQRFALRASGAFDATAAMRFALAHQNPLLAVQVTGEIVGSGGGPALPDSPFSLLQVDQPDLLIWALKPADDLEGGVIVRVWNLGAEPHPLALTFAGRTIGNLVPVSHVETPLDQQPGTEPEIEPYIVRPQQMRTFAITFA